MTRTLHARAAGAGTPANDKGPTVAAAAPQENKRNESPDFQPVRLSGQALRAIEGEEKAARYLARLRSREVDPDELAIVLSMLYGPALRGFCRAIESALGEVRHA